MPDVVIPQLARKETIPLPFMEPGDDLLKDGAEPSSPTDYCAALLSDSKLHLSILPPTGVSLMMCAPFHQVNLDDKQHIFRGIRNVYHATQMEATVSRQGLSQLLAGLMLNTEECTERGHHRTPSNGRGEQRGPSGPNRCTPHGMALMVAIIAAALERIATNCLAVMYSTQRLKA